MFRFTMLNHLCRDMEQVLDTSGIPDRIRQDVSRSPGGDSRIFLNNCIGCHIGMDPLTQAFAYYNFDATQGRSGLHAGRGAAQVLQQRHDLPLRLPHTERRLDQLLAARTRTRCSAGIRTAAAAASGAKTMGEELANSTAFARCQVEKVFRNVCLRSPVDGADRAQIDSMVGSFRSGGYRLKQVFAESASYCMGD